MSDLKTIMPVSATPLTDALDALWAGRLAKVDTPVKDLCNPDTCPEAYLPYLARAVGVRVWDPDWPVALKRNVVRSSIPILQIGGTHRAVEQALQALGVNVEIKEWFEAGEDGTPVGQFPEFPVNVTVPDLLDAGFRPDYNFGPDFADLVERTLLRVKSLPSLGATKALQMQGRDAVTAEIAAHTEGGQDNA